jgi:outer membrane protein assembly factor BamB
VTYAQPLGWGADQGVVIVRHVFSDGTNILSMYGHLDPPSVVLRPGDCVTRGEQIGQIGKPRSPAHLHFEIRTHMPTSPGPGYWSVDPTLAGWEPPSLYIWNKRIIGAPGVLWARPFTAQATRGLGIVDRDTFVAVEDNELAGINVLDGELRWRQPSTVNVIDAVIDADRSMIYAADYVGRIEAFRVPDVDSAETTALSESALVPLWKTKLDMVGFPTLMPLPGGGVVVSSRRKLFGVSQAGELLWEQNAVGRVFDWALTDDHLVVSMLAREGSLWAIDESGPVATATRSGCRPVTVDDQVLLYASDGIYRLNPDTLSAELLYALPRGSPWLGDVVALPDGGLLVAHMDRFDRRLIALNAAGEVRWQRSVSDVVRGQQHLLVHDGRVFLISKDAMGSFSEVTVFSVDSRNAGLTRIFNAGSRNPLPGESWAFGIGDDRILIDTGGGGMAALDTRLAIEAVKQAGRSQ